MGFLKFLKVKKLILVLRDKNPRVRREAAVTLGKIGSRRVVEPLIAALKDKGVRWEAAKALGKIGDNRAVEPLVSALKDKDVDVREHAAEALGEIGDSRIVKPLIAALKDENNYVRMEVAESLGKVGDSRALESLTTALKDENMEVRENAIKALVEIGDSKAVEPLIGALKDVEVREHAAEALDKLGWEPSNVNEKAYYLVAKGKWDECVEIGRPAIGPLITVLNDVLDREDALEALGEIVAKTQGIIGVVFGIDALGGGVYGSKALRIFMKNLDPHRIAPCVVYHGDTKETLTGRRREYCIALLGARDIDYIKTTFSSLEGVGLAPVSHRFIEGKGLARQPLVLRGYINTLGEWSTDEWNRMDHDLCKNSGWGYNPIEISDDVPQNLRKELLEMQSRQRTDESKTGL